MATETLTDQNISDTYSGLLHAQGVEVPVAGQVLIYDGEGNASSVKLGRWGAGMTVGGALSSESLSVNGIAYPASDGTAGQLVKTDGLGTLSFTSLQTSDFPALVPNPAATYVGLSSITVDSTGRVTQVKESSGGASTTSQYRYPTPINLLTTPNNYSGNLDASQSNMPADATYAILRIEWYGGWDERGSPYHTNVAIYINGTKAVQVAPRENIPGVETSREDTGLAGVQEWYAELDSSKEFTVDIVQYEVASSFSFTTLVDLTGYANFQTLSNP